MNEMWRCDNCETKNDAGDFNCRTCGNPRTQNDNNQSDGVQRNQCNLVITRKNQWFLINPAVKICVDGKRTFKIENGATISISVSAGRHSIKFWLGPREKTVPIVITQEVRLTMQWNRIWGNIEIVTNSAK